MAEDFYSQFGLGTGNTSIGVQDLAGVSIAAVKELDAQLQEKNAEIERLQNEIKKMKSSQNELEKRLAAIEQAIKEQK
jgi:cell division protein FtsB